MNTERRTDTAGIDGAPTHVLVIGGTRLSLAVAEYLTRTGSVTYASGNQPSGGVDGVDAIDRDIATATDVRALASEVADVDLVVAVGSDSRALLTGRLIRQQLEPRTVVAGIFDPANAAAFEGTGVETVDIPRLLADEICDRYR